MKHIKRRRKRPLRGILLALLAVFVFATVLGVAAAKSRRAFPNVYVGELKVGGKKETAILSLLDGDYWQGRTGSVLTIKTFCGAEVEIDPVEAGVVIDAKSAAKAAVSYGKEKNIYASLRNYLKAFFTTADVNELETALRPEYIRKCVELLQSSLNAALDDSAFRTDMDSATLTIAKGYSTGLQLDIAGAERAAAEALENGVRELEWCELSAEPVCPDFENLKALACFGPENAAFSQDGTHEILEGKPGCSFDVEAAKNLWTAAAPGEEIRIPLELLEPAMKAENLEELLYRDLLGAMTTKYNNSGENRCSNVRLATSLVNGTVLFPGEEFSFNKTVGKRTEEAGFLLAPAYAGYDDIQEELGGGVCQVSTGVYASALFAFLDITSHTCHIYPPNYIQLGTDATVSIPAAGREIDLKFVNSKNYPIKIVGYCEETENPETGKPLRTVTIEIWGTLEPDDYMPVEFDNAWGDVYDYDRKIEPAYPDRPGYRIQFTHDETEFEDETGRGLRTLTYRRVYDASGTVVEKLILNRMYDFGYGMDTYYYMK